MANNFSVSFRVVDRASNAFRRIARSTQELERAGASASAQFANMAQVALATTGSMVAAFSSAAVSAAEVEDAVARLSTVTRGSGAQIETALGNAKRAAIDFSTEFTASTAEIVDAQFQIATAGVAVEEQIAATQGAFKLAIATQGTFGQSTQLLGSLLNTFGKAAEFGYLDPATKVQAITDKLSLAVQRFQVTLPVLAESLKFVIGPASTLGLKFAEVTSALGVLNTAGFRGSLAGTALSNMFNKLDRAVEMLNLDPSKFTDLNGNLKDMSSFLEEVEKALAGMTSIEQQNKLIEVFDIRAGRVVKTLLNQVKAIRKNTIEMELNTGATEKMAKAQQDTLSATSAKAANALRNVGVVIGDALTPMLKAASNFVNLLAVAFRKFIDFTGPVGKIIINLVAVIATLGVAVVSAAVAIRAFGAAVQISAVQSVVNMTKAVFAQIFALGAHARALVLSTAVTLGVAAATGTLIAALTALAVKLTVMTVGIYGLVLLLGELMAFLLGVGDEAEEFSKKTTDGFNSISQSAARAAAEADRLAKIAKADIKLLPDEDFGNSPLAKLLERLNDGSSVTTTKKLNEELDKLARVSGDTRFVEAATLQLAGSFEGGASAARKFASSAEQVRSKTDLAFQAMSDLERVASVAQQQLRAQELQMLKNADGSAELAEQFKKINDAISTGDFQSVAEIFGNADFLVQAQRNAANTDFAKAIRQALNNPNIKQAIDDEGLRLAPLLKNALEGAAERTNVDLAKSLISDESRIGLEKQITNALGTIAKTFEQADDGVLTYSEAVDRVSKSLERANGLVEVFSGQDFTELAQAFKDVNFLDDRSLEEIQRSLEDALGKVKADQLGATLALEANKWKAVLEQRLSNFDSGPLGKQLTKAAFEMGEALQDATRDFLGGGQATDFADALRDELRNKVLGDAALQLASSLTTAFQPEIRKLKDQVEAIVNEGFDLTQLGQLPTQVRELFEASGLSEVFGDILLDPIGEVAKELKEALETADISLDVLRSRQDLDNITASFAARLQDLTVRAMDRGGQELQRSISEASRLLGEATAQGADNSIVRLIEQQLESLLEAQKGFAGGQDPVNKMAAAIGTSANKMQLANETGIKAAGELNRSAENIQGALTAVTNVSRSIAAAGGAAVAAATNIEIGGQTNNVNVTINGTSAVTIDEADIEAAKEELRAEYNESLDQMFRDIIQRVEEGR